jgi:hypothetical protein
LAIGREFQRSAVVTLQAAVQRHLAAGGRQIPRSAGKIEIRHAILNQNRLGRLG